MSTVAPSEAADLRYEPLLETESSIMYFLYEPSVTTISYFKSGHHHGHSGASIRARLRLICEANPWLTGRLLKDKKRHADRVLLCAANVITESDLDAILSTEDSGLTTNLDNTSPYAEQAAAVLASPAQVPVGYNLIGTPNRISKFTLVPMKNGHGASLALIISMTHAVVDGYTYYKIVSMLSGSSDIESLSWSRKQDFVPKMKHAMGAEEHAMLLSPGLTLGMVLPKICCCGGGGGGGGPAKFQARFVDEAKVTEAKSEATSRVKDSQLPMAFACSTNDILTSSFAQASRASMTLMAVNWRARIEDIDMSDSGNYESVMVYDEPSAAKPELIRRSLEARADGLYRRVNGLALPGFFGLLKTKFAMITNWAFPSFKADLRLRDDQDCDISDGLTLHLPIYDPKAILFPVAIIFRPCPDKLAVLYCASPRDLTHERLMSSGAPLGDLVDKQIFE